jgi:hypothetical protein
MVARAGFPQVGTATVRRTLSIGVCLCIVLCVALPTLSAAAAEAQNIDWRSSPLDLNLRGLNGERYRFRCPAGKAVAGQVVGSGPYSDASSICAAGVHAGAFRAAKGGEMIVEIRPGRSRFRKSIRHYVHASAYEGFWGGSFIVLGGTP